MCTDGMIRDAELREVENNREYFGESCQGDIVGSRLNSLLMREPEGTAEMFEHDMCLDMCFSWTGS